MEPKIIQNIYRDVFKDLDQVVQKMRDAAKDKWSCGYVVYLPAKDRNSRSAFSINYFLNTDLSNAEPKLFNVLDANVKAHISEVIGIERNLLHPTYVSFGTLLDYRLFFKKNAVDDGFNKNDPCIFLVLPGLCPPQATSEALILLVNTSAKDWLDFGRKKSSPYFSKAPSDIIDAIKRIWRQENAKNFLLDAFDQNKLNLQKLLDEPGDAFPIASLLENILKAYNSLYKDLSVCESPREVPYKFIESITMIAHMFFQPMDPVHKVIYNLVTEFVYLEEPLFMVPGYRDHFYHQYMTFLLGAVILGHLPKKTVEKIFPGENADQILQQWFLASIFHDFCYPVEKLSQVVTLYIARCLRTQNQTVGSGPNDGTSRNSQGFQTSQTEVLYDPVNAEGVDRMVEYLAVRMTPGNWATRSFLGRHMRHRLGAHDHGAFSAVVVYNAFQNTEDAFIKEKLPAICSAIAFHMRILDNPFAQYSKGLVKQEGVKAENDQLDEKGYPQTVVFEQTPLLFLLVLCDCLQDWGRVSSDEKIRPVPDLSKVDVSGKKTTLGLSYRKYRTAEKTDYENKCAEVAKGFSRLESKEWQFCVEVTAPDGCTTLEPYESKFEAPA